MVLAHQHRDLLVLNNMGAGLLNILESLILILHLYIVCTFLRKLKMDSNELKLVNTAAVPIYHHPSQFSARYYRYYRY